ncbi:MAG: acetyl-CoA carboxylase biotin carboxylase subunit, partial [Anaerovoracaceae bacterium]
VHLGERDCSIQRRNQKILEEAPAFSLSEELRQKMGLAACKAAETAGYKSAGTVEFIVDKDDNFYFIEMNTRIQVEHPVTEMVTGVNIVREQLRIASGLPLSFCQEDVKLSGHAIECRITAEKIYDGFAPCPGKISFLHLPAGAGVRVDSALYTGCEISPYYDSMVAKVIVRGDTRLEAIRKMRRALGEMVIEGVETILPVQYLLMYNSDFLRGGYDTGFMDAHLEELLTLYEKSGGKNESD